MLWRWCIKLLSFWSFFNWLKGLYLCYDEVGNAKWSRNREIYIGVGKLILGSLDSWADIFPFHTTFASTYFKNPNNLPSINMFFANNYSVFNILALLKWLFLTCSKWFLLWLKSNIKSKKQKPFNAEITDIFMSNLLILSWTVSSWKLILTLPS